MDANTLSGNGELCLLPLALCDNSKPRIITIIIVVVVVAVALVAFIAIFFILNVRHPVPTKKELPHNLCSGEGHKKTPFADLSAVERSRELTESSVSGDRGEIGVKLSFLRDDIERFDLTELLRASAEVLGSGYFGSSYKAANLQEKIYKNI